MPILAILAAGLLARAAAAAPAPAPSGLAGDVRVSADEVRYDVATGRVLLEGNAMVSRGGVTVRARSATYDPEANEVRAAGGVLLTDARRAISADAIRAVLGGEMEAEGVLAFVKDQPVDLSGVRSAEEAARAGRNRLVFSGSRLRGVADRRFELTGARLTLCDCPGGAPPSWEVTARSADVIPGKRAILRWSVLRITPSLLGVDRPVPVFAFPWLYLPLGDRQSGLLFPSFESTEATGFRLAQPLYLTLGRSADATLAPDYAFGRARSEVAEGRPSVRGPGGRLELRWAPAEGAAGVAELAWIHDLDAEPGGASGDRWALALRHGQALGARADLRAALRLAGDPVWDRDLTPDVLGRAVPYRRSDVIATHRGGPVVLEAAGSWVQPLSPGRVPEESYGPLGADLGFSSRLAAATATLLPGGLGPARLSGRAGAARFGATGALDRAGRPDASRADARAALELPVLVAGAVTLSPWLGGAALAYALDGAPDSAAAAWGLGGVRIATEVSRRFGRLRHSIAPRLEWRAGSGTAGEALEFPAYDALDRAAGPSLLSASPGAFQQARAAVETRLESGGVTRARAEVGQEVDLRDGRLAETFVSAGLAVGPVAADARARFFAFEGRGAPVPTPPIRSPLDELTELAASVSLSDRRGDALRAGFLSIGPGGSGGLVAGIDPLFDVRPANVEPAAFATAGVRAVAGAATLGYDALFWGRPSLQPLCSGGTGLRRVDALDVQQHVASLAWSSSCRCFRVAAVARVNDCGGFSYTASIDLARLAGALAP